MPYKTTSELAKKDASTQKKQGIKSVMFIDFTTSISVKRNIINSLILSNFYHLKKKKIFCFVLMRTIISDQGNH